MGQVTAGGDVSAAAPGGGHTGTFLLDPDTIIIDDASGVYPQYELINPNPSDTDQFGTNLTVLSTGNVVVTAFGGDFGATDAGAVYLFNEETGALISALTGAHANDQVGSIGVTALSNGNYVVASWAWANGSESGAGAVTWGDGTKGVTGDVTAANSLVGRNKNDQVGMKVASGADTFLAAAQPFPQGAGRVWIGLTDPSQLTFSRATGQDMTIRSDFLTRTLNAGTDVRLEATTDIIVNSDVTVDNPAGNGGDLAFLAGRSILLNANITTDNGDVNFTANTGGSQPSIVDVNRDAGVAAIRMSENTLIDAGTGTVTFRMADGTDLTAGTSGAITLASINAGRIDVRNLGTDTGSDITLLSSGVLTASGTGRAMDLAALNGEVINLAGDSGLVLSGGGHYGIFADTPAGSQIGTPASYLRRYNVADEAAYDALNLGANFAAFRYAPILTITVDDTSRAYGEDNPTFTYSISGFETGDGVSDLVGAPSLTTTATESSDVGTFEIVSMVGTLASEQGYQFSFESGTLTVQAAGEQPSPEQPSPEQPSPEQPSPEQPSPEQPSPEQPSPEQPTSELPVTNEASLFVINAPVTPDSGLSEGDDRAPELGALNEAESASETTEQDEADGDLEDCAIGQDCDRRPVAQPVE